MTIAESDFDQKTSESPLVNRLRVVASVLLVAGGAAAAAVGFGMQFGRPIKDSASVVVKPDSLVAATGDVKAEAQAFLRRYKIAPLSGDLNTLLTRADKPEKPTQPHSLLGHPAPAIALNDATDRQRALSESLKNGPVVLVFYYGYSCNHCVSQLFDLQEDLKYFRELGAEIVAISPDSPAETREKFAEYGRFDFTVLSDPDNRAAEAYEAFHRGQSGAMEFSQHGTFVIGRDGRVAWAYLGPSPFADNATLLHVLARLEGRDPTSASHATPEATGPLEASLSSPSQTALAP